MTAVYRGKSPAQIPPLPPAGLGAGAPGSFHVPHNVADSMKSIQKHGSKKEISDSLTSEFLGMFESQFVEIWQTPGKSVLYHKRSYPSPHLHQLQHQMRNRGRRPHMLQMVQHGIHHSHREIELASAHILHIVPRRVPETVCLIETCITPCHHFWPHDLGAPRDGGPRLPPNDRELLHCERIRGVTNIVSF